MEEEIKQKYEDIKTELEKFPASENKNLALASLGQSEIFYRRMQEKLTGARTITVIEEISRLRRKTDRESDNAIERT